MWNLVTGKGILVFYSGIDFLRRALDKDPKKRPSAIELTQHLWFSQAVVDSPTKS